MRISDWSSDVCSSDLGVWTAVHPSRNSKLQEKARPEPRFPLTALRVDYSTLVPNEAWLSAGLASGVGELADPCTTITRPAGVGLVLPPTAQSSLAPAARNAGDPVNVAEPGPPLYRLLHSPPP